MIALDTALTQLSMMDPEQAQTRGIALLRRTIGRGDRRGYGSFLRDGQSAAGVRRAPFSIAKLLGGTSDGRSDGRKTGRFFDGALERLPKDRAAYLRVVCAGDDEMRREVETFWPVHADASGFLARPVADLGHTLHYSGEESGEYPAGFRAGPYQLEKRVGRGGMGSVWLASRSDKLGDHPESRRQVG